MRLLHNESLKLTGADVLGLGHASRSRYTHQVVSLLGPAAFCEAAPRVKCGVHLPLMFRGLSAPLELLLSLLFALSGEATGLGAFGSAKEADGAN